LIYYANEDSLVNILLEDAVNVLVISTTGATATLVFGGTSIIGRRKKSRIPRCLHVGW